MCIRLASKGKDLLAFVAHESDREALNRELGERRDLLRKKGERGKPCVPQNEGGSSPLVTVSHRRQSPGFHSNVR